MQQIDSLHFVAVSDTAVFISTTDAGRTWRKVDLPTKSDLYAVHFCDSITGIVVGDNPQKVVLTTSDGGHTWKAPNISLTNGPAACRALGPGRFAVLCGLNGPIYITKDDWKSVDSTSLVFDTAKESAVGRTISLANMRWQDEGHYLVDGYLFLEGKRPVSIVFYSEDSGRTWYESTLPAVGSGIRAMTSASEDTILASAPVSNTILQSNDGGKSWHFDTVLTSPAFGTVAANGLERMSDGSVIACFAGTDQFFDKRRIYRYAPQRESVNSYERIIYGTRIYPNPASLSFEIQSNDPEHEASLFDVLGREVCRQRIGADGKSRFNTSSLARGVYEVRISHDGQLLPVGRVVLVN